MSIEHKNSDLIELIAELESHTNEVNIAGMRRFGIISANVLGIPSPMLKSIAKRLGKNHLFALELWDTTIYEARFIAFLTDDPKLVTEEQMDKWANDFDSWAVCDSCCLHLFSRVPNAHRMVSRWAYSEKEYVRRAAFALIASLTVHDKKCKDEVFEDYLLLIEEFSDDNRNFIKKSVNWALRQIGKRNINLNQAALECCKRIKERGTPAAKWIASDAIRELTDPKTVDRIYKRKSH